MQTTILIVSLLTLATIITALFKGVKYINSKFSAIEENIKKEIEVSEEGIANCIATKIDEVKEQIDKAHTSLSDAIKEVKGTFTPYEEVFELQRRQLEQFKAEQAAKHKKMQDEIIAKYNVYLLVKRERKTGKPLTTIAKSLSNDKVTIKTGDLRKLMDEGDRLGWDKGNAPFQAPDVES